MKQKSDAQSTIEAAILSALSIVPENGEEGRILHACSPRIVEAVYKKLFVMPGIQWAVKEVQNASDTE